MRWEQLFDDLEAAFLADERAALDADVADRARSEQAALTLADRLRGHVGQVGHEVTVRVVDTEPVTGQVAKVGGQWLLLLAQGRSWLVPLAAVVAVSGLRALAAPQDETSLARRLPLTVVLRGLARDRAAVRVVLRGGARYEGTIDRVGADHLDLAEHPADVPRRPSLVRGVVTLAVDALVTVEVV